MDIEGFRQKITAGQHDYECLAPAGGGMAHFRFIGQFEGKPVIWDAYLYTLAYYVDEIAKLSQADRVIRQFIQVGDQNEMGRKIEVGLNLTGIDEASILKTIIMIRQYKKLSHGRHEYGEKVSV
ncbi:MAG: hypothetical protein PVF28_08425 [Thioalkalispiraceae bacterium]|jgi:hypothetical protein